MPRCRQESAYFVDTAPFTSTATVEVNSTPLQVWEVLTDAPSWTTWFHGMKSCQMTSPTFGVGATRQVKVGPLRVEEVFIAWDQPDLWGFSATEVGRNSPMIKALVELVELEPTNTGGSTLTYRLGLELASWARPLGRPLSTQFSKAWRTNLANIDDYVANHVG